MQVQLLIRFETTAYDLGAPDAHAAKAALAVHLRQLADRIERSNGDEKLAWVVDDETDVRLGEMAFKIEVPQ